MSRQNYESWTFHFETLVLSNNFLIVFVVVADLGVLNLHCTVRSGEHMYIYSTYCRKTSIIFLFFGRHFRCVCVNWSQTIRKLKYMLFPIQSITFALTLHTTVFSFFYIRSFVSSSFICNSLFELNVCVGNNTKTVCGE